MRAAELSQLRLAKDTTNLFRKRGHAEAKLDLRSLNGVLSVDPAAGLADVEALATYETVASDCFANGVLPTVTPELKSITIGGAATGIGIESSSFRYGLVHETIEEMEILLADGEVVLCTPDNEYSDLFHGFPNSYGTLGYALRIKVRTIPAKPFVALTRIRHEDAGRYVRDIAEWCGRDIDFVDGVVFGPNEMYITIGRFVDEAPYLSDYSYMDVYYRSIPDRSEDFLTTPNYIWRWDTDWFWCSRYVFAEVPLVRRLLGRKRLNSITYQKIVNTAARFSLIQRFNRLRGLNSETVIQDVHIPLAALPDFLEFFQEKIGLSPIGICPFRVLDPDAVYDLYRLDPTQLHVNVGFWGTVTSTAELSEGHLNRLIQEEVAKLGGKKMLYSTSYYDRQEFWSIYNKVAYDRLKAKYDPNSRLKDLYEKCVERR
jgi:FAD/FMN-containing dehydrogenase